MRLSDIARVELDEETLTATIYPKPQPITINLSTEVPDEIKHDYDKAIRGHYGYIMVRNKHDRKWYTYDVWTHQFFLNIESKALPTESDDIKNTILSHVVPESEWEPSEFESVKYRVKHAKNT